jgi:hypothetical protein
MRVCYGRCLNHSTIHFTFSFIKSPQNGLDHQFKFIQFNFKRFLGRNRKFKFLKKTKITEILAHRKNIILHEFN